MAQVTTIDRVETDDAVKLTANEIAELGKINKMLDIKRFYVGAFLAILTGAAYIVCFGWSVESAHKSMGPLLMFMMVAMGCIPLHQYQIARFCRRIGIGYKFFRWAVLLDENGVKLADQSR